MKNTLVEEFDSLMSCVKLEIEVNVIDWNLQLNKFKEKLRQLENDYQQLSAEQYNEQINLLESTK